MTALPLPASISLHLKHVGLNQRVMPPFTMGSERAELHGDETLMVGETYELSATSAETLDASTVQFVVQPEPTRVDLTLERRSTEATLIFRAAAPPRLEQKGGSSSSTR